MAFTESMRATTPLQYRMGSSGPSQCFSHEEGTTPSISDLPAANTAGVSSSDPASTRVKVDRVRSTSATAACPRARSSSTNASTGRRNFCGRGRRLSQPGVRANESFPRAEQRREPDGPCLAIKAERRSSRRRHGPKRIDDAFTVRHLNGPVHIDWQREELGGVGLVELPEERDVIPMVRGVWQRDVGAGERAHTDAAAARHLAGEELLQVRSQDDDIVRAVDARPP